MKTLNIVLMSLLLCLTGIAQEKKIDFNKGVVNICTTSQIKISGYDGDQVIIKNTNPSTFVLSNGKSSYFNVRGYSQTETDSVNYIIFPKSKKKLEAKSQGLKPLGTKEKEVSNSDIDLDIQIVSGELLIRDIQQSAQQNVLFFTNSKYEILIPNSAKLRWNSDNCGGSKSQNYVYSSTGCELLNFSGETQISSLYRSVSLTDVTGPALVNTVGGDIKVVFNKEKPKALFSLISNDGDIDVTMPENTKVSMNITGKEVLSNLNFKILTENFLQDKKTLNVELNGGGKRITTETEYGTVYLRKQ